MDGYYRNPDAILKQIEESEEQKGKGKLKIFFGYAAGVGKTYAMLEAAHSALKTGADVIIGYVEPHTRPDTAPSTACTSGNAAPPAQPGPRRCRSRCRSRPVRCMPPRR